MPTFKCHCNGCGDECYGVSRRHTSFTATVRFVGHRKWELVHLDTGTINCDSLNGYYTFLNPFDQRRFSFHPAIAEKANDYMVGQWVHWFETLTGVWDSEENGGSEGSEDSEDSDGEDSYGEDSDGEGSDDENNL